jgi:hypothetical protein
MFKINWWGTWGGLEKNEATDTGDTERIRANPAGLAPLGNQDFKANNVTLALRYSF